MINLLLHPEYARLPKPNDFYAYQNHLVQIQPTPWSSSRNLIILFASTYSKMTSQVFSKCRSPGRHTPTNFVQSSLCGLD